MPLELFTEGDPIADTKAPIDVPIGERWSTRRFRARLVNPANRRKLTVIVVGTAWPAARLRRRWASRATRSSRSGTRTARAARTAWPRRAGSTPRRTTATTATACTGCSTTRSRARLPVAENNVHRLAEVSVNIIDQCVAQGVPFAREYGGLLDNRSFGGAQVSRTFYARGQTGSSCSTAPTRPSSGRSPARSSSTPAPRCST